MAHSPGPWTLAMEKAFGILDAKGRRVFTLMVGDWMPDVRLLVAAPELLAMVREKALDMRVSGDCDGDHPVADCWACRARVLIARIEGTAAVATEFVSADGKTRVTATPGGPAMPFTGDVPWEKFPR